MSQAKQPSKRKRRSKTLPVLGAAGLSLSLASGASAVPGGPATNLSTPGNGDGNQFTLGEEEIADVSLATFYVFDKEGNGTSPMVQLVGHGSEAAAAAAEAIGAGLTACGPGALTTTATSLWKGQRRLLVLAPRPQALVPLALIGTNF
jgi:hypothetical protein